MGTLVGKRKQTILKKRWFDITSHVGGKGLTEPSISTVETSEVQALKTCQGSVLIVFEGTSESRAYFNNLESGSHSPSEGAGGVCDTIYNYGPGDSHKPKHLGLADIR